MQHQEQAVWLFAARSGRTRLGVCQLRLALGALVYGLAACTIAPEPPATPRAVVQLSERYDRPTASLDQNTAEQFLDQSIPDYTALKTLAGLSFLRGVIARALKSPDLDEATQGLDVQGSLAVHAPCPGWDGTSAPREAETGYVDLFIGVDDSRVQRAFSGTVTACRFMANVTGERARLQANMQLEVDLGHSLALGDPVPAILLSASQLTAQLVIKPSANASDGLAVVLLSDAFAPDGLKVELNPANRPLSLRIVGKDRVETLIDLEPLDLGAHGTLLLGLRDNGSFNLRGGDSAWDCSSDRSTVCVRSD